MSLCAPVAQVLVRLHLNCTTRDQLLQTNFPTSLAVYNRKECRKRSRVSVCVTDNTQRLIKRGSVRGFGYTVYMGLLNGVYGIFMLKFGY